MFVLCPSIRFRLRVTPQKTFFVRSFVRSFVAKIFGRRENFWKKSLGRRDRFRQKIVKIGAILAIFEPLQVFLFGTQELSCLEHSTCLAWNTGNVLRGSQEMSCLERSKCLAWNTGIVCLEQSKCLGWTQEMFCLEHRECFSWNIRIVVRGNTENVLRITGNFVPGPQELSCVEQKIFFPKPALPNGVPTLRYNNCWGNVAENFAPAKKVVPERKIFPEPKNCTV